MLVPGVDLFDEDVVVLYGPFEGVTEGRVGEGEAQRHVLLVHPPQKRVCEVKKLAALVPGNEFAVAHGVHLRGEATFLSVLF